jgi:hypothetical protein
VEKYGRGRLLDDLKDKRVYWKLKEKRLDRTLWRTRYGRGYGLVVRQTAACINANQTGRKLLPQFDLLQFSVGQKKTSWYGVTLSKGGHNSDQTRGGGRYSDFYNNQECKIREQTFGLYTGDGTFGIIMQLRLDMGLTLRLLSLV